MIHDYGERLEAELQVYSPTEVVAEKLRATRQQLALLENRGWTRNRARDYYDLWGSSGITGTAWTWSTSVSTSMTSAGCGTSILEAPRISSTSV